MSNIPQSKSDLEWQHHFVYYTFIPMVLFAFSAMILSMIFWVLGPLSYKMVFVIQWSSLTFACFYIGFLGEYVMPVETYRKLKSGEWGNNE